MAEGRIHHGSHAGVQVLRYQGEVRYTLSPALDALIQKLLRSEGLRGFVVDLTAVDAIDSTHLGILARLTGIMQQRNLPKVTLVSNRPAINEVVEGMGLDKVFHRVSESSVEPEKMREVPLETANDEDVPRLLIEAHRALMALNENNRDQFRDVVKAFETEVEFKPPGTRPNHCL